MRDKTSTIRKIVNTLFEQQLSSHERVTRFRKAATELEHLFASDGKHRIIDHVERKITAKLKELINIGADLRFKAPDVTSDLAGRTELWVHDGEVSTRPENQGHGAQRSIVLALLQMYAEHTRDTGKAAERPTIFLVEEPEIYMHPEMCRRMRDTLLRIAQGGIGQVICTTHSPVFLDLADRHDGITIIKKKDGVPNAIQRTSDVFDQSENGREGRDRLRMLLNFDPTANEVFFSDSICLVEGDCEVAAVDAIAMKLRESGEIYWPTYLAARRSAAIINCRGKWTILAFQKVLKAFGINYRIIHDSDDEEESASGANARISDQLTPGDPLLIHSPNFERQIFQKNWRSDKPWRAAVAIAALSDIRRNKDLIKFFEFAIGCTLEQLRQPTEAPSLTDDSDSSMMSRTDRRNELRTIEIPETVFRRAEQLNQVVKLAAGPSFAPDAPEGGQFIEVEGAPVSTFAVVSGDSMADTLFPGDVVALRRLDSIYLGAINDEGEKIPSHKFREFVDDGGIYVVAINDEIERGSYTIKRMRIRTLDNGGWFGQICADNQSTTWGNRGRIDIFKNDRVHFAFKVVGLVTRPSPEESTEESLSAAENE